MAKITIVGAGMMGSAFALPLVDRGHQVSLVGTPLDDAIVESYQTQGCHPRMGVALPKEISVAGVAGLEAALSGADIVALGVSSAGIDWAIETLGPLLEPQQRMIMISKGLARHGESLEVLPRYIEKRLPANLAGKIKPVAVAGPCIAGELARRAPTCVVFTGSDYSESVALAEFFRTEYYHVFPSRDVVGVEVCAALKNAYAMGIALGIGLNEKCGGKSGSIGLHNYESAVFAQAIVEMRLLIEALGGDPNSAHGLAGAGDLDVTCNGGRTGRFGRFLGLGLGREQAIDKMDGATLECLEILEILRANLDLLEAEKGLPKAKLPLLIHLMEVALDSSPLNMPFERFFQN